MKHGIGLLILMVEPVMPGGAKVTGIRLAMLAMAAYSCRFASL